MRDRHSTILSMLRERDNEGSHARTLCSVATEITELSGAGIVLMSTGPRFASLCTSNVVASTLMEVEITVGEGPAIDACVSNNFVDESHLDSSSGGRWFAYAPLAREAGAEAVFGFPIRSGDTAIGALSLYRDRPGSLSPEQATDGFLMASVAGETVMKLQAGTPEGALSESLEQGSSLNFAVHQAAGMVAVQASMSVADALVALRSHAFATTSTLSELAVLVITRQIYFDLEDHSWHDVAGDSEQSA